MPTKLKKEGVEELLPSPDMQQVEGSMAVAVAVSIQGPQRASQLSSAFVHRHGA